MNADVKVNQDTTTRAERKLRRREARAARRRRPGRFAPSTLMRRFWIVLVVAAVVGVAGFAVHRLRDIFGVHDNRALSSGVADDIKPFNPKHVVYEVYGPPGATANINYLDVNAQPRRVDDAPLPWTLSVVTTLPSVSVNVVAQTDAEDVGCRITVNGVVKEEREMTGVQAQTFCIVKSA